jgi:hypothetical protein
VSIAAFAAFFRSTGNTSGPTGHGASQPPAGRLGELSLIAFCHRPCLIMAKNGDNLKAKKHDQSAYARRMGVNQNHAVDPARIST